MSLPPLRIHILGASGSGTTTLGAALAREFSLCHLDSDYFFWAPAETPFSRKRNPEERLRLVRAEADPAGRWVLSGSMLGWGDFLMPSLDLAIYIWKPAQLRRERLALRESERFGERVGPDGPLRRHYETFLDWASSYDSGGMGMRSRMSEEEWMARLSCPILTLEGDMSLAEEVSLCSARLTELGHSPWK